MRKALLFVALLPWMLAASPIAGGSCGAIGTLAEFVALGDTGCYLHYGVRIYDIAVSLPTPADLSTFSFMGDDIVAPSLGMAEALAWSFPAGATLSISWRAPLPATGGWSGTADFAPHPFAPNST